MKLDLLTGLYVFMLAAFIGFEVIRRVSPLLHTPLMSLTNALDPGDRRDRGCHQQCGWRLHHHRPHASDV